MRKMSGRTRALSLAGMMAVMVLASMARAGNLDPSAPPAPTMKTLNEIPPTWSQILPAADRFEIVLSNSEGVLDKETGLVWERAPFTTGMGFTAAKATCLGVFLGGRFGWRLPTASELMSLFDISVPAGQPRLPTGHPFIVPSSGIYWTASQDLDSVTGAGNGNMRVVDSAASGILQTAPISDMSGTILRWCVRTSWGPEGV